MIERILKAIGIVGTIVICGGFSFVLAYSMVVKSWSDSPFNLAFWVVLGIAVLLGRTAGQPGPRGGGTP